MIYVKKNKTAEKSTEQAKFKIQKNFFTPAGILKFVSNYKNIRKGIPHPKLKYEVNIWKASEKFSNSHT